MDRSGGSLRFRSTEFYGNVTVNFVVFEVISLEPCISVTVKSLSEGFTLVFTLSTPKYTKTPLLEVHNTESEMVYAVLAKLVSLHGGLAI